mmetsp:Transcript_14358/g.41277  ORF Transcript_14358/g.41277 Transcript_14358/m.41277 type:complete len:142 (+) Transcript_14358:342-767(+)
MYQQQCVMEKGRHSHDQPVCLCTKMHHLLCVTMKAKTTQRASHLYTVTPIKEHEQSRQLACLEGQYLNIRGVEAGQSAAITLTQKMPPPRHAAGSNTHTTSTTHPQVLSQSPAAVRSPSPPSAAASTAPSPAVCVCASASP